MALAPSSSPPLVARFPAYHFVEGCGVAIFHVATERVVLCYHTRDGYWFLPKGRRDAGEESRRAAEREGFEESGYRNRVLPLPIHHRQPLAHHPSFTAAAYSRYTTESVWTELAPVSHRTQYMLRWYIAETLPPDLEDALGPNSRPYVEPPPYPHDLRLKDRVQSELKGYEPRKYENTGVDEEEALYESFLVHVETARRRLRSTVMEDVVKVGWEAICQRLNEEEVEGQERCMLDSPDKAEDGLPGYGGEEV